VTTSTTESDRTYQIRWTVGCDVVVTVDAPNEDVAYDLAVGAAKERLEQVAVTVNCVAVHADIDGVAADEIETIS